jgi:hypothetical protein
MESTAYGSRDKCRLIRMWSHTFAPPQAQQPCIHHYTAHTGRMARTANGRDHRVVVRLDDQEFAELRAVAGKSRLTGSDWIRMAIRQAYEAAFQQRRPAVAQKENKS